MPTHRDIIENQRFASSPFFVMNDIAYERTYKTLKDGAPFTYSYIGVCPHASQPDALKLCTCPRFMNKLIDGGIMRVYEGQQKPVFPESIFRILYAHRKA